jgi:threonylcarbamoyladenosine tRNA methylthiotransferase MtaB
MDATISVLTVPYHTVVGARGAHLYRIPSNGHVKAAAEGVKEIVLTGVNIGDFGRKNGESLFDLLRCFDKERIVERVRLSSIEPELLSKEIIRLVADSQVLMPHFHIPLQSGSNTILKRMKRKYTTEVFESRVRYIKQ